jgi:hypothetical protein
MATTEQIARAKARVELAKLSGKQLPPEVLARAALSYADAVPAESSTTPGDAAPGESSTSRPEQPANASRAIPDGYSVAWTKPPGPVPGGWIWEQAFRTALDAIPGSQSDPPPGMSSVKNGSRRARSVSRSARSGRFVSHAASARWPSAALSERVGMGSHDDVEGLPPAEPDAGDESVTLLVYINTSRSGPEAALDEDFDIHGAEDDQGASRRYK